MADQNARDFFIHQGLNPEKPIKEIDFSNTCFIGQDLSGIEFIDCNFTNCDFSYSKLNNCNLYRSVFKGSVFYVTEIKSSVLIRADFSQTYMYGVHIRDVDLNFTIFDDLLFEDKFRQTATSDIQPDLQLEFGQSDDVSKRLGMSFSCGDYVATYRDYERHEKARREAEVFNLLKKIHYEKGYRAAGVHFYVRERKLLREATESIWRRVGDSLFDLSCGYGEQPFKALAWMVGITLLMSIYYGAIGCLFSGELILDKDGNNIGLCGCGTLFDSLRVSVDKLPFVNLNGFQIIGVSEILSYIHGFINFVMLSFFIVTLNRRINRD